MARMMAAPQDKMFKILTLSIATVNRKANLIGQVQTMVEQSGDPIGFDAARWVARWLAEPNPALTGESYMRMMEGQKLVYKRNHPMARADAKRSLGLMSGASATDTPN